MDYESPIEVIFGERIRTYLDVRATVESQVECETPWATFRLDFLLTGSDGRRVGVECDGKNFHDEFRDEFRDALILGEERVDAIFRMPGGMIRNDFSCGLAIESLGKFEPSLFDPHAIESLNRSAKHQIRDGLSNAEWDHLGGCFFSPTFGGYLSRRGTEKQKHWLRLYGWAVEQGPMPFKQLYERRLALHKAWGGAS